MTFDLTNLGFRNAGATGWGMEAWEAPGTYGNIRITFIVDPSWARGYWSGRFVKLSNWLTNRGPSKDRWFYWYPDEQTLFIKAYKERP